MRLPFRHTSKWSLLEDLHFHRLPYERSVLLFRLHSNKMVGRVGFEPTNSFEDDFTDRML